MKYDIHPAALAMPEASREDYETLRDSIQESGQLEPILMYEHQVLDGRTRLKACLELKIEPWTAEAPRDLNGLTPSQCVWAYNVARRHLSTGQRSALVLGFKEPLAAEASERQLCGKPLGSKDPNGYPQPEADTGRVNAKLAELAGVSEASIKRAVLVSEADPAEFEKVKQGEVTLGAAVTKVRRARNGSETVSYNGRQAAKLAFGGLVRALEALGVYNELVPELNKIIQAIEESGNG